ncbi:hypothetical protein [Actinomyces polynesiensis]|uniref:hypothetical protein n=1 Tax=Actinomyces polynesiensis TaxID=1325934 RepID=UPI000B1AF946|nr:hypothetical protein [Actinomyces polynesiensis]
MPRSRRSRKRPWGEPHQDLDPDRLHSLPRSEVGPDGTVFHVQYLRSSTKEYTCPGCRHPVTVGSANVVVWPQEAAFGVAEGPRARRHWHDSCWRRRLRPS